MNGDHILGIVLGILIANFFGITFLLSGLVTYAALEMLSALFKERK